MSLSKQQLMGAVGGGVFAVGVLALGWMFYSAWSEKTEAEEQLEEEATSFRHFNEATVYPSKESIDAVKSNETNYAAWRTTATAFAAQGDTLFTEETGSGFKQRLQAEVRRMLTLPGGVDGKIAASSFLFGFEQYLGENGAVPKDADVPRLAVQLDVIARLVNLFAETGAQEVKSIERIEPRAKDPAKDGDGQAKPKKSRVQRAKEQEPEEKKATKQSYAFTVLVRPACLVAVLNRLASTPRFTTVRNLTFAQATDVIGTRLSAAASAKEQKTTSRRGSRRRAAVEEKPDAAQLSDVFDPEVDAVIQVSFTLDVYDFGQGKAVAPTSVRSKVEATTEVQPAAAKAAEPKATEEAKPTEKPDAVKPAATPAKAEKQEEHNDFI